jgi:hypothetical protein
MLHWAILLNIIYGIEFRCQIHCKLAMNYWPHIIEEFIDEESDFTWIRTNVDFQSCVRCHEKNFHYENKVAYIKISRKHKKSRYVAVSS